MMHNLIPPVIRSKLASSLNFYRLGVKLRFRKLHKLVSLNFQNSTNPNHLATVADKLLDAAAAYTAMKRWHFIMFTMEKLNGFTIFKQSLEHNLKFGNNAALPGERNNSPKATRSVLKKNTTSTTTLKIQIANISQKLYNLKRKKNNNREPVYHRIGSARGLLASDFPFHSNRKKSRHFFAPNPAPRALSSHRGASTEQKCCQYHRTKLIAALSLAVHYWFSRHFFPGKFHNANEKQNLADR